MRAKTSWTLHALRLFTKYLHTMLSVIPTDINLDVAEHMMQIVRFTPQGQMVENVLVHQLDVRVA